MADFLHRIRDLSRPRRAPARRAPRASARARDYDWHWSGWRAPAADTDREAAASRIRFNPTILPPYVRRTKSLEVLISILYLKGISTGDFERRWPRLWPEDFAWSVAASTIARLKEG